MVIGNYSTVKNDFLFKNEIGVCGYYTFSFTLPQTEVARCNQRFGRCFCSDYR